MNLDHLCIHSFFCSYICFHSFISFFHVTVLKSKEEGKDWKRKQEIERERDQKKRKESEGENERKGLEKRLKEK